MKSFHSPRYFVFAGIFLFLLAFVVAQAGGSLASFFGHSPEEIENEFVTVENPCDDPAGPSSSFKYKYCEALCPTDYYALSGSCDTLFDITQPLDPILNPLDSRFQYNFSGTLPNLRGWGCFNGSLANVSDEYVKATVVCARAGDAIVTPSQNVVCGDYRIEGSEVCDKTNFGDWLDCSNFYTAGGQSLCNGQLKCNDSSNACGGFDISECVYCNGNNNPCNPPFTLCLDGTCQTSCKNNNGSQPVGSFGENCPLGQNCLSVPNTPQVPGYCGNGWIEAPPELCDPSVSATCSGVSYPPFGIICPDGTSISSNYQCTDECSCEPNPTPCCNDLFGPECRTNDDCPAIGVEYGSITGTCELGCCVYP